jgi:hypothetical protein
VSIRISVNGQNLPCGFSSLEYFGEKWGLKEERLRCQKRKTLFYEICVGAQVTNISMCRKRVKLCQ